MNPLSPIGLRLLLLFPLVFAGALLPLYAQTRRGILFGVTVSVDFPATPTARAAIRRYRLRVLLLVAATCALAALLLWTIPFTGILPALIPGLGTLAEIFAAYALWQREATLIKPHAATVPLERIADLSDPSTTAPILAAALALLPLAATALWLKLHSSQLPARWPQHWNATGAPDRWGTLATALNPLLAGALTILFLTAFAIFLARASGPQVAQRRRALVPTAALAWIVAGVFIAFAILPLTHISHVYLLPTVALYFIAVLAISLWMILRSNLTLTASSSLPYDSTPDNRWLAGIFYYNPADASVLVPKRFGIGWTLNFARPSAWICLGATLLFFIAIAVLNK